MATASVGERLDGTDILNLWSGESFGDGDWAEAKMVMMMHLCTLDPREGTKISPSLLSALYGRTDSAGRSGRCRRASRSSFSRGGGI